MGGKALHFVVFLWLACLCASQVKNWAGNIEYDEALFSEPESLDEVIALVKDSERVSVVGTRHSFNNVSQTVKGAILSTKKLNKILSCCEEMAVTVQPGITYAELGSYLHQRGYALPNYASLPHLSVGGAIATATHGSGAKLGNLATSVRSVEMVAANGDLVRLTRGEPLFKHAVVTLGAGGVIVEVSLDVEAAFDVQQCIYTDISFKTLKPHLSQILEETYSVSLFTQFRYGNLLNSVWLKHKLPKGADPIVCPFIAGRPPQTTSVHPIPTMSADACSPPGVGPSYMQLPHFLPTHTPSHGAELQTELFLKREHMEQALKRLFLFEKKTNHLEEILLISEVRFIAADDMTLSPQRILGDAVGLHFTWKPELDKLLLLLPQILDLLSEFKPVPHWAKVFQPRAFDFEERYGEVLVQFKTQFLDRYDPQRKFTTDFVRTCLFPTEPVSETSSNVAQEEKGSLETHAEL